MAVPGRRNGLNEDGDEESNGLFEEEGLVDFQEDTLTPPHLRDLSRAAQFGDLPSLRLALGRYLILTLSLSLSHRIILHSLFIKILPLSIKPCSSFKIFQSKTLIFFPVMLIVTDIIFSLMQFVLDIAGKLSIICKKITNDENRGL